ncbi:MAG: hypothetical protein AAF513_16695 [Pseudomonadota bacterium]
MPIKLRLATIFAGCLCFNTACQGPAPAPPPPVPEPATVPDPVEYAWLYQRLDLADAAIERDQITYPREGSAYQIYREILTRYPDQADAIDGINTLVERYIDLALQALQRGALPRARSMLARARIIDAQHPGIEPTEQQIRLMSNAERTTMTLAAADLAARRAHLAAAIAGFARPECRYRIYTASDRDGRWIYQALRSGVQHSAGSDTAKPNRLRAEIEIRRPTAIERLCFSSAASAAAQE